MAEQGRLDWFDQRPLSQPFFFMSAKRTRKPPTSSWVTYKRSYLVTVGLVFIALAAVIWAKEGDKFAEWPTWFYFVVFGLPALGLALIGGGLLAGRATIERLANSMSTHWASIIVMIVAFPVYFVMSWLCPDGIADDNDDSHNEK